MQKLNRIAPITFFFSLFLVLETNLVAAALSESINRVLLGILGMSESPLAAKSNAWVFVLAAFLISYSIWYALAHYLPFFKNKENSGARLGFSIGLGIMSLLFDDYVTVVSDIGGAGAIIAFIASIILILWMWWKGQKVEKAEQEAATAKASADKQEHSARGGVAEAKGVYEAKEYDEKGRLLPKRTEAEESKLDLEVAERAAQVTQYRAQVAAARAAGQPPPTAPPTGGGGAGGAAPATPATAQVQQQIALLQHFLQLEESRFNRVLQLWSNWSSSSGNPQQYCPNLLYTYFTNAQGIRQIIVNSTRAASIPEPSRRGLLTRIQTQQTQVANLIRQLQQQRDALQNVTEVDRQLHAISPPPIQHQIQEKQRFLATALAIVDDMIQQLGNVETQLNPIYTIVNQAGLAPASLTPILPNVGVIEGILHNLRDTHERDFRTAIEAAERERNPLRVALEIAVMNTLRGAAATP